MKNFFRKTTNNGASSGGPLNLMISRLQENLNSSHVVSTQVAHSALSLESLRDDESHALYMAGNEISTALEAIAIDIGIERTLTEAQIKAASAAGILAGDYRAFLAHKLDTPMVSTESMAIVQPFGIEDALSDRSFSLEAYDERENRNAVIYSIAYNMQSARQDEFGETFFPTIVVTPDNVGFGVTVNLMMVYDGIERKLTGVFQDFQKKNIIRAVADPTILRKEQTKIIPNYRVQSADKFVANTVVPSHVILLEGESITTAPLLVGKKVDLIGLSQTDTLLAAGIMDQTDSIDPYITLQNVYVSVTDGTATDILKINTLNLPLANFTYSTQNNYRLMTMNFTTTSVLINKLTKQADGSALVALAGIVSGDLITRLELVLNGTVNIETGETTVFGNALAVHTVQDSNGDLLDLTAAPALAIVTTVAAGKIEGYDLQAYRTNMNRRQRGQLIDVTKFTQLYNVPLRSPITTIHPINTDGQTDASDVQALITATRIRTSNEAVTALINTSLLLREYVDSRDLVGTGPDILGVGRFFVMPTYYEESIDMNLAIDSIKSHERAADIQAVLVNKIRDYAFRMYRDSQYKAASDAFAGGISPTPIVIIGTDPVLARYLTVTGDLRTLGGEFDIRIVSSLDTRVSGKIFISFGVFDENRNVGPNPLNFGNMVWSPELVLTANISRGGSISKETVVQPRYLFVTHLPILTVLEITNVPDVLNKVPLNMHSV
jgi:hypothetical protein